MLLLRRSRRSGRTSTRTSWRRSTASTWRSRNEPESYGGAQLQPGETAKTLRMTDGEPLVTDGPFTETKEMLSGFYLVDADTEARALEIACEDPDRLPMGGAIEVRPIVER